MTPEEKRLELGLPEEARLTVVLEGPMSHPIQHTEGEPSIFAFVAIGKGEKTKIVAHGYGPTPEEAVDNMKRCPHWKPYKPRTKAAT